MVEGKRYWGQGLLLALIGFYQRLLSGRFFFRRARCSFEQSESCSHYGARVVREVANNLPQAVMLIVARLGRCRSSAIYRDGEGWRWGPLYGTGEEGIDPAQLIDAAVRGHETPSSQAVILRTGAIVAAHSGDPSAARHCLAEARRRGARPARPIVRNGARLSSHLWRVVVGRLAFLFVLSVLSLGVAWLATGTSLWGLVGVTLACAIALATLRQYYRSRARFSELEMANRFLTSDGLFGGRREMSRVK